MGTTFSIKRKTNRFYITLASLIAVFVLTFISTFIISSVFAPINTSDAESVTVEVANTGYYITVSANDVDLLLSATPDGAVAVAKDTVNTKTNCNGYKLFLSSATTDPTTPIMNPTTHVVDNVPTNSLILEGSDSTSGDWIPATAGSFMSATGGPQAFSDNTNTNTNTWGFAVPSGSTGLPAGVGTFDASYGVTSEDTANKANKFAAVPLYTTPQLIQETSTPAASVGVNLDIYYGVYANMTKTAGNYSADVLYTVLGKDASVSASVSPSTITKFDGTESITIATPIFTSMPLTTSDITATVGGTSCPVTAISTVDANNDPSTLKVTCTAPAKNTGTYNVVVNIDKLGQSFPSGSEPAMTVTYSLGGTQISALDSSYVASHPDVTPALLSSYSPTITSDSISITTNLTATGLSTSDVAVSLTGISSGATSGITSCPVTSLSYDDTSGTNYLVVACTKPSTLTAGTYGTTVAIKGTTIPASTTSANTLTVIPKFYAIANMQEMTASICNDVKTPNNGVGSNITLVSNANDYVVTYGITADNTAYVPQRTLYDIRGADGTGTSSNPVAATSANAKTYTVRKLADGNCWMGEDLALPLSTNKTIEASYNTTTADTSKVFTITTESTVSNADTSNYILNRNTKAPRTQADADADGGGYANNYYYNWYAATATKGTGSTGSNVDVDGSICPLGWKLPSNYTVTGNSTTGTAWSTMSWSALTNAYLGITINTSTTTGYQTMQASPLSMILTGYYYAGDFGGGGTSGRYWASTSYSASQAYNLVFDSTRVRPQEDTSKVILGFNIRCLVVR